MCILYLNTQEEDQHGDLNAEFRELCSAAPDDILQLLYGEDITARLKTISDTYRITAKLGPITASGTGARHDSHACTFSAVRITAQDSVVSFNAWGFLDHGNCHKADRAMPNGLNASQREAEPAGRVDSIADKQHNGVNDKGEKLSFS